MQMDRQTSMGQASRFPDLHAMGPGDVAPSWVFIDRSGRQVELTDDEIAGNWIVLCIHAATAGASASESLQAAANASRAIGARFFHVRADEPEGPGNVQADVPVLVDRQNEMSHQLGLRPPRPLTIVLRPDGHFAQFFDGPLQRQLLAARTFVEQAVADDRTVVMSSRHPPVLLVPEVFSKAECRTLIEVFHSQGQVFLQKDVATDHIGADYKMKVFEHMREDRIDHFFFDPRTVAFLSRRLHRVLPEIRKAFQYEVTKHESLRIACYQGARGGYGHGHRDNVPPTEYRRFAMSINLNAEAFDGGELRFPEYGDVRYRPESGTAIIFSSSLLHEALQVTRGRRYVFLAFLFGET